MSIWLEKDGKLASFVPATDVLAPVVSLMLGLGVSKLGGNPVISLVVLGIGTGAGIFVGRLFFVRKMKLDGWK